MPREHLVIQSLRKNAPWSLMRRSRPLEVGEENIGSVNRKRTSNSRLSGTSPWANRHDEWQVGKHYFSAGSLAKQERRKMIAAQPGLMAG